VRRGSLDFVEPLFANAEARSATQSYDRIQKADSRETSGAIVKRTCRKIFRLPNYVLRKISMFRPASR